MRLYLSSQNIGNHADRLIKMVGERKTVLYIGNAKDEWAQPDRAGKVLEHRQQFELLGFEFEELDLRRCFGDKKAPLPDLDRFGLVWASGGNTFLLRSAMKKSGFDSLLVEYIQKDRLVYGGSSAGSIVMTPGLDGCEEWDDISQVKKLYGIEPMFDGLNMVPFYIVPHYASEWAKAESDGLVGHYVTRGYAYYALRDGEVYVVDEGKEEHLR